MNYIIITIQAGPKRDKTDIWAGGGDSGSTETKALAHGHSLCLTTNAKIATHHLRLIESYLMNKNACFLDNELHSLSLSQITYLVIVFFFICIGFFSIDFFFSFSKQHLKSNYLNEDTQCVTLFSTFIYLLPQWRVNLIGISLYSMLTCLRWLNLAFSAVILAHCEWQTIAVAPSSTFQMCPKKTSNRIWNPSW